MEKIINIIKTPAARSTAIYYFGNFLLNIGRYFFHLILLRFLTPGEYGEFLSYLSLTYLLSIPMGTIGNVVTKYVSEFNGRGDTKSINHFYYYLIKKVSPLVFLLGFLLIIFAQPLSVLFKAHSVAFVVLGVSIFLSLFQTVIGSYLAAFQKFVLQTAVGYLSVFLTIIFSIIFINLNLGATGAVLGQLVAGVICTFIIFISIKSSIVPEMPGKESFKISLASFTGFSLLYSIGSMSLISTDVLLVRFLFDPITSGLYSSLSILGRMIYFGLTPFTSLALPIASHRYASKGNARAVFFKLGGVLLIFGFIGASIFSAFPSLVIRILSGASYLAAAPLLPLFAFAMVFFALNQSTISYLMATNHPEANYLLIIATIIQPIAYVVLKSSFSMVVLSNLLIQIILFVSLFIFVSITSANSKAGVKSKV